MTKINGAHKFGYAMKALDCTIQDAIKTFCENTKYIIDRQKRYMEHDQNYNIVEDVIFIESQLQEIEEMIEEFNELKKLGVNKREEEEES